jgi:hypothetical protein
MIEKILNICIIGVVSLLFIACTTQPTSYNSSSKDPQKEWQKAVSKNSIYSYKAFVYRYKNDKSQQKRITKAKEKIKKLVDDEYASVKLLKNRDSFERFISANSGRLDYIDVIKLSKQDIKDTIIQERNNCNTIKEYVAFVYKYSSDEYADNNIIANAKNSIKKLLSNKYNEAIKIGTLDSVKIFIDSYEYLFDSYAYDTIYNIYNILAQLEYKKAVKTNTLESYNYFVDNYIDITLVSKAKYAIFKLEYNDVVKNNDINDYAWFIDKYVNIYDDDTLIKQAQIKYDKLLANHYAKVSKHNTAIAYKNFLSAYGSTVTKTDVISKAQKQLQKILTKEYKKALKVNTLASYQSFINLYPNTDQANILERKLPIKRYEDRNYGELKGDVKIDMIKTDLKQFLGQKRFEDALMSFRLLDHLDKLQGPALTYFYAQTLYATGDSYGSKQLCQEWLNKYDKKNKYYKKVLKLYSKVR